MPHGRGLGRKQQPVDAAILHTLELVPHRALELLIADLQPGPGWLAQIHDLAAAIGLQLRRCAGVVRMCIDNHSGTLLVGALGDKTAGSVPKALALVTRPALGSLVPDYRAKSG